jgi:hypothetical protein
MVRDAVCFLFSIGPILPTKIEGFLWSNGFTFTIALLADNRYVVPVQYRSRWANSVQVGQADEP